MWKTSKSDAPVSCVSAYWSSNLKWITCFRVQMFTELKYRKFAKNYPFYSEDNKSSSESKSISMGFFP